MSITAEDFTIVSAETNYEKKEIQQILTEIKDVDPKVAAKEIIQWIINNVEQFVDNKKKMFKLDLIIDAEDGSTETLPVTRKLQDLYRAIPNDPELDVNNIENTVQCFNHLSDDQLKVLEQIQHCKEVLDAITHDIYLCMKSNNDMLVELFKRMSYYYEILGMHQGTLLLEELNGEVDILQFEYEAFPVGVKVRSPIIPVIEKIEGQEVKMEGGKVVNEYVIPEGFTI